MIQVLRQKPFPLNLVMFNEFCGYSLSPEQVVAQIQMLGYKESAGCWGRQLGKTLTVSLTTLFMAAILGWRGGYRTPMEGQCEPPLEYWGSTPFYEGTSRGWLKVNGKKMIHLAPVTDNQMRGKTLDFLVYDEQAGCSKKQEPMLLYGKKMIQNSPYRRLIRISTPICNTMFETDYYRLEKRGQTTHYTYKDFNAATPWLQDAIEEILETQRLMDDGHYPIHLFKQETLAEFAPAGGSIFSDYEERTIIPEPQGAEWIGIDINPKTGHTAIVTQRINPRVIYLKEQIDLGTDTEYAAKRIKERMRWNTSVELELNGPGEEAIKTFWKVLKDDYLGSFQGISWTDQLKIDRIMQILKKHVIVNPQAKKTFRQIRGYSWDPHFKLKPNKTPDDHWIDGFLHSCHYESALQMSATAV